MDIYLNVFIEYCLICAFKRIRIPPFASIAVAAAHRSSSLRLSFALSLFVFFLSSETKNEVLTFPLSPSCPGSTKRGKPVLLQCSGSNAFISSPILSLVSEFGLPDGRETFKEQQGYYFVFPPRRRLRRSLDGISTRSVQEQKCTLFKSREGDPQEQL